MESIVFLILFAILTLKVYALYDIENLKKSFIIASLSEVLYLGLGVVSFFAISAVVLHFEYQFVFRVLVFLILLKFFDFKNSTKLSQLTGVGYSKWGIIFGFAIFGSLGISLITSKQLIINSLTKAHLFEMGFLIVAISIIQAIYLITIFENIVIKKGVSLKNISNNLFIYLFTFLGLLVFLFPKIYLILPNIFGNITNYSYDVKFDFSSIRMIFSLLFLFIMSMIFLYSLDYIKTNKKYYYSFLLILTISLIGVILSITFENFYLFWELMTISSYMLIMTSREDTSIKAAKIYFVMCIAGAYLLQLSFSTFYTQNIQEFINVNVITLTTAVLLLIGFGVKAGIVPFHQWLPIAHPEAPSSISAPLSGVLTKAGLFGIILIIYQFKFTNIAFSYLLIVLGLVTLFYAEIKTLFEKDIKKLFAYSTIGQVGEIVTVLGLMSSTALVSSIYHIINHAVVKDLLFLSAGILILSAGSRNLDDLKGIGKKMPHLAFPLGIGIFAISAFPPFGNFNSKFLMIYSAIQSNNLIVAFGLIIGALIGFLGMLRVFKYIFLFNPVKEFTDIRGIKLVIVYLLALTTFLLGIFGDNIINYISLSVSEFINHAVIIPHFLLEINLPIMILIIGAIFVYLFGESSRKAGLYSALVSLISLLSIINYSNTYNLFFAKLVLFMATMNFIYAAKYMDHSHKVNRFFTNFLVMIIGIVGVVLSKNIYSMFFYWEIMGGWALYIALTHEEDLYSIKEASKYLIYNFVGAGIIMIGLSIIMKYGYTLDIFKHLPINNFTILAIVLLTLGFLAKAAQLPIRIDYQMHPKPAPTPISGYISSVMLKTGPFMLGKMFYFLAAGATLLTILPLAIISHVSAIIGVITILMGAAFGLLTNSMKRLLIFLTVAEIGYIITGFSLVSSDGFAGGMMHLISHMFFKDLLFLSAGAIFYKTGIDNLNEIGGLARKMPITFMTFMVAVFSTAGVPLYSGFVSKWMIYHALMEKGYVFLAIFSLLGSIMILLVFVKFLHSAYFGKLEKRFLKVEGVGPYMAIPMIILAILNIIIGIFPGIILKYINIMLKEFGFKSVEYTLTSVTIGDSTLNMASLAIYLIVAIIIGFFVINYFGKKVKKTHIFLSGVRDLSNKEIHLHSENYYEPLIHLIEGMVRFVKRLFGLKGGYIER